MGNTENKVAEKKGRAAVIRAVIVAVFAAAGMIFFLFSYTTGYYTFGKANCWPVFLAVIAAIILAAAVVFVNVKFHNNLLTSALMLVVTALLVFGMIMLLGDRVEGIGFTIVTKFDAGHGGEEACWMSIIACGCFLAGGILNIINSFLPLNKSEKKKKTL